MRMCTRVCMCVCILLLRPLDRTINQRTSAFIAELSKIDKGEKKSATDNRREDRRKDLPQRNEVVVIQSREATQTINVA